MLDTYFQTSLGHIASSLHELYSVLRLASFEPPKTKLPLITPARVQPFAPAPCAAIGEEKSLDGDTEREANKKKRPFVQTKLALTTLHSRAVYVRPDGGARQSGRDTLRQRSHAM